MQLLDIRIADVTNYKKPSMVIVCPKCDFKCEKECGIKCCHNSSLVYYPLKQVSADYIARLYTENKTCKALVFSGLEPILSFDEMTEVMFKFREVSKNPIIIYTGYKEEEMPKRIKFLQENFKNVIIKFGRFIPNQEHHIDEVLGVELASPNQYAKKIC